MPECKPQTSIRTILVVQLALILAIAAAIFIEAIVFGEDAVDDSIEHGRDAVATCFDQYLGSIRTTGEAFVLDISKQVKEHVVRVVDSAEDKARIAATAVERMGYMDAMEDNGWHGSHNLPSLGWTILGPLEEQEEEVVADIVVAGMNSTEDFNNWVWFGLPSRNPNPTLSCEFYYYRNASDLTSYLWCLEDLWADPGMPSPSPWPHLTSPAIVRLQNANPCTPTPQGEARPLLWMPLFFVVGTNNPVALTSVFGSVFGPDGTCQGLVTANVRFSAMSTFLVRLVESANYADLNVLLIETTSEKILGTSFGSAIIKKNQTGADEQEIEVEVPAALGEMEDPLAVALHEYIETTYGSVAAVPTPLIDTAIFEGEEYLLSFDTFSRRMLNLTICSFLPVVAVTGATEVQRQNAQIALDLSADELEDDMDDRLVLAVALGVTGLFLCAVIAGFTAIYLSRNIESFVAFMEALRSKISSLVDKDREHGHSTADLCEPLPPKFFPEFHETKLTDLNKVGSATKDLCQQLFETWNAKQDVFRHALEQRQFTASIAHDIRNPLHGVLGIISLMRTDLDANKDKLPLLEDTAGHMSHLLNDMVDLSKIQGGKVTHVMDTFDPWDTLDKVYSLYKDSVAASGGSLSCGSHSSIPLVYSDEIHVQRIVTNFVSNATKYAAGSDILLMAMEATPAQVENLAFLDQIDSGFAGKAHHWANNAKLDKNEYVVLACLDHGRGISRSKLSTVFEAYQQAKASDRYEGTGLGLAIVEGLAIEMGGGVGVQSLEGAGSLFWVVLPASRDVPPKRKPTASSSGHASAVTTIDRRRPSRVLVVDDVNLNLMLLQKFLSRLDVESEAFQSPADALAALQADPENFDLVLSDFNMPDMSGGELCLALRADPHLHHLPFIVTSGSLMEMNVLETYQMDGALMKPFTIEQVQDVLEAYLHRLSKWSRAPPESKPSPLMAVVREDENGTASTAAVGESTEFAVV